ncbi:MAG TPA: gliding motility-associated protein GldE [Bacteroidales bacterium]|nr:gliding motility-associated protein GldE [Bacteroidales bacterium]HOL98860.1 gliding motility-associated protein GldE [Bacteroidales bacterium]HOM37094.1 gliding motility-associated protein GldE [Bacteroidales bacterium]HRT00446.1 gliding motility-associated protein GldE [Bacteroidales bacterium]HRT81197.1 gliding motility-associated protein GldE [Bacteroidales bacterium]
MDPEPYLNTTTFLNIFYNADTFTLISIFATAILLVFSGLISGSEVAFFSINKNELLKLKSSKSKNCKLILKTLDSPNYLLATILIANNFINIAIIILSTYITTKLFSGIENPILVILTQLVGVTFLILFIGEIFPKIIAGKKPIRFAIIMVLPIRILYFIFYPASYILVNSTKFVNKKVEAKHKSNISIEELSHVIELASEELKEEKEMLEGIVNSTNLEVKDIMTQRINVFAIEYNSSFPDILDKIIDAAYSRIPVYAENLDNIKGILYIKDLLPYIYLTNKEDFRWQKLVRTHYLVPETKKINELLKEFQTKKLHIAIVVDEYGGVSGIVTLEDILEEFVGEINDESDLEEKLFEKTAENEYIFDAKTSIVDFCKLLDIDYKDFQELKGESDSLAGLLLEIYGEIPEKNKTINVLNFEFSVVAADERRIKKIKVKKTHE